jgi:hypothetical protein
MVLSAEAAFRANAKAVVRDYFVEPRLGTAASGF